MDHLAAHAEATARNAERIAALAADGLGARTPCPDWSVADLVAHMIGGQAIFAGALGGQPPPMPAPDADPATLALSYEDAAAAAVAAFAAPGALDRDAEVPIGTVPGGMVVALAVNEAIVHGWDLAAATGQDTTIDETLAADLLAGAQMTVGPQLRAPDGAMPFFGPAVAVADDAPASDRLLAFLGRDPGWRPHHSV